MDYGPEVETYSGKTVGVYGGKFYPFHNGHLAFIMRAQSMVDILFVAVQYDEAYEQQLSEGTKFPRATPTDRTRWVTEALKDFPNIRVISQYEHRSDNHMNDPEIEQAYRELLATVGGRMDIIFSNTWDYDEYFRKYLPDSKHVVFYEEREDVNISATEIREQGVFATWEYLPKPVQKFYTKRVALCGVESTGKTHLSRMLAAGFNTVTAEEYGRVYYDNLNGYIDVEKHEDYVDIAVGHCHILNQRTGEANKVLIADTDLIYTQFFHIQAHGYKHPVLDALILSKADKIDEYVFIEPFNEHELDGTRLLVTDDERARNNAILKDLYVSYGVNLNVVDEEDREQRYKACYTIVKEMIQ